MILHHIILYQSVFTNLRKHYAVAENFFNIVSTEGNIAESFCITESNTLRACTLAAGTDSFFGYILNIVVFNQNFIKTDIRSHFAFRLLPIDPCIGTDHENSAGHLRVCHFGCHIMHITVLHGHIRYHPSLSCGKYQNSYMIEIVICAVCDFNPVDHPVALITQQNGRTVYMIFSDFIL